MNVKQCSCLMTPLISYYSIDYNLLKTLHRFRLHNQSHNKDVITAAYTT